VCVCGTCEACMCVWSVRHCVCVFACMVYMCVICVYVVHGLACVCGVVCVWCGVCGVCIHPDSIGGARLWRFNHGFISLRPRQTWATFLPL